jgi:predicted Zn finger-like uncharacterized protein
MRIACPNCSAEYEVPDTLLSGGPRLLRCARCDHQFQAAPAGTALGPAPAPAPAPAPVPAAAPVAPPVAPPVVASPPGPEPPPATEPPEPSAAPPPFDRSALLLPDPPFLRPPEDPAPRGRAPLVVAWLLSAAVLGGAGWATWHFHAEIVAAWPPAARFYQALGMR